LLLTADLAAAREPLVVEFLNERAGDEEAVDIELYVIVELDVVWADPAVPPADLPSVREGQSIIIVSSTTGATAPAKIIFLSPLLDKDTRSARVVTAVDNPTHTWRPGAFITAKFHMRSRHADLVTPKTALQMVKGEQIVFAVAMMDLRRVK
jgi:cobalt-zinc-cadmium efflux system membrane fusion protein